MSSILPVWYIARPGHWNRRITGLWYTLEQNVLLYKLPGGVKEGNRFSRHLSLTFLEPFSIKHHSFGKLSAAFGRETYMEESKA
jgi:hypothetical protein